MAQLRSVAARGGLVTVFTQAIKLGVQIASLVMLSRLLSPEDFGVVAMVTVFVALGDLLRDLGIQTAALQVRVLTQQQASNLFWLSSGLGLLAGALLAGATPLLVHAYDEPRLSSAVPAMAVALALSGVQAQFQVQLARQFRFTALATTDLASQMVALVVAVLLAESGRGHWALIAQVLTSTTLLLLLRVAASGWRPSPCKRGASTKEIVGVGGNIGASQLMTYAASNVDSLLIGLRWDAADLGVYNRAFQLYSVPISTVLAPLTTVLLPLLQGVRSSGRSVESLLLRLQMLLGLTLVLTYSSLAALAPIIIPVVLGKEWEESSEIFQILALGGSVQILSYVSYWTFLAEEKSRELMKYSLVSKTVSVFLIAVGSCFSPIAVAASLSVGLFFNWGLNLLWLDKVTDMNISRFAVNGAKLILAGLIAFSVSLAVRKSLAFPSLWVDGVVTLLTTVLTYACALVALPQVRKDAISALGSLRGGMTAQHATGH